MVRKIALEYNVCMIEQLREHLRREPFQPFRIVTTSGPGFDVLTPEEVAIAETYLFYCYPRSDRSATVRLTQIVALESMPTAA